MGVYIIHKDFGVLQPNIHSTKFSIISLLNSSLTSRNIMFKAHFFSYLLASLIESRLQQYESFLGHEET